MVYLPLKKYFLEKFEKGEQIKKTFDDFNLYNSPSTTHYLVCIGRTFGYVEFYDTQSNSWHSSQFLLKLPIEQTLYQLELMGSMLYAFGGLDGNSDATNKVWSFDLSQRSSKQKAMAPMKQRRDDFSSVLLNDTIYALGGWCEDVALSSCERYDSQQNIWSSITPLNIARYCPSATVYNGCIYIAGGVNGEDHVERSVEKYDPQSNKWTQVPPMANARMAFSLTPFAGRLWAIGGWYDKKKLFTVESYDPVSDTWREEAQLNEARNSHSAIEFNDQLYVVGDSKTKTVEKYTHGEGWIKNGELLEKTENIKLLNVPEVYATFFTNSP